MRYQFSDCILDTDRHELRRATSVVPLRPRVFALLVYLIEHAARAVTKDELFAKLWPGRVVSDATLNACVKELRAALGDTGDSQRVVQTLHGYGLRFIARVETHEARVPDVVYREAQPVRMEEHKFLSVLVCSLADSEPLAERLGAEGMHELMRIFLRCAREAVERHAGVITEHTGDGFIALFGAPIALEDHARRAVQAALELQAAWSQVHSGSSPDPGARIALRAALHSGDVVVGPLADVADQLYTALGPTSAFASRLHRAAPGGALLATSATHRLVAADVEWHAAAPVDGQAAFRIVRLLERRAGVPRRLTPKLSPFVGRERELKLLLERLAQARTGAGQVVCVVAEPGMGKSRLLHELTRATADDRTLVRAQSYCVAPRATSPYFAVSGLLRALSGIAENPGPEDVSTRISMALTAADIRAADAQPLLLELLGAPVDPELLSHLGPDAKRVRTFRYLIQLVLAQAARQPCLLTIEDAHWMDATSRAFLGELIVRLGSARVLLVITTRPGIQLPWSALSVVSQLSLARLSDDKSRVLFRSIAGCAEVPQGHVERAIASAQGNPFFLEEYAWSLATADAPDRKPLPVPDTVQMVIAARIDQLAPDDKQLLQCAAVIGSRIDEGLLTTVSGAPASAVQASLARLQEKEFLSQTQALPASEFRFKHALTQDVAYASMVGGVRRRFHRRAAEVIEHDGAAEIVAHHFSEAGEPGRAFEFWRRAGQRAIEQCANVEAVEYCRCALAANAQLASTPERRRAELELRLMLGPPLMACHGFAASSVDDNYTRACALATEVGQVRQRFTAAWGSWLHNTHRGRIDIARKFVDEVLELSHSIDTVAYSLQAHHAAWTTSFTDGPIEQCREHAQAGVRLYEHSKHHGQAYRFGGHDPGLCARGVLSSVECLLGRPDTAQAIAADMMSLAARLTHPYSQVLANADLMWVSCFRREPEPLSLCARKTIEMCDTLRSPGYRAVAVVRHGWAVAMLGDPEAGTAEMEQGMAAYLELGLTRHAGYFLTLLAQGQLLLGRTEQGLAVVAQARELIARAAEPRWLPEILRMEGVLRLAASPREHSVAAGLLRESLEAARAQGLKAFELRAATDLARLSLRENDKEQARSVLGPVLATFTEGLDLPDLREARAVMEAM